jgi:hypothetical protein
MTCTLCGREVFAAVDSDEHRQLFERSALGSVHIINGRVEPFDPEFPDTTSLFDLHYCAGQLPASEDTCH